MFDGRIISGISVFVSVAEAGGFSRAGAQLGLSRSGVAKAIARLEERTGLHLFDRTSRALKLTDEGRTFFDEVAPLLERLGRAAAPSRPDDIRGRLRVSSDAAFGTFLLIPALPYLIKQYPKLKVELIVRDRIDNLLAEGIDVAIRFGEPEFRGLEQRLLFESRIVTCASRAYVERHGMPQQPEDILEGHNCIRLIDDISGKPHAWVFVNAAGRRKDVVPDCNVTVNDAPSIMSGVLTDFGIVRALDFMVERHLKSGRLVEILPQWNNRRWPAYLYTPARSHISAGFQAFLSFALSYQFCSAPEAFDN
jgi:DNA-binding transcriptional LysR family regulator